MIRKYREFNALFSMRARLCLDADLRGKKGAGIAAALDDLPDDGRTDMGVARLCDQEDRLDAAAHNVIELGDGFFVVEIGGVPQATQQVGSTDLLAIMRRQALESVDPYPGFVSKNRAQPMQALFEGKQIVLLGIFSDGDDDLIE